MGLSRPPEEVGRLEDLAPGEGLLPAGSLRSPQPLPSSLAQGGGVGLSRETLPVCQCSDGRPGAPARSSVFAESRSQL